MKRAFVFMLAGGLGLALAAPAQAPETVTSAEIYLRLNKLNVLGTVLYMAAHPDDENSRLIAYMAKERLYRTAYFSMTRGDGGQNLIGDEQGVDLGLIRTQEMMAARRVDGAEQFFSRAFDFGFSKSTDEALATWGKEKILSDAVWVIRKFQPDVIITRFPPDSRAGHGHHSASAVIAREAFSAAADPNRFPEQFKYGVGPWQVKRVLWNSFNFGAGANTTSEDQMKIDVGGFNAIIGKSYGELAAISRTNHKSQGAALTPARGQSLEYFTLVAGEPAHSDPMEGVETGWRRVEGGEKIEGMVKQLIADFSLAHPERSVTGLAGLYKAIGQLKDGYWKTQKLKEVRQLVADCSGLWLEAVTRTPYAVQGDSLGVTVTINNRLSAPLSIADVALADGGGFSVAMKQELEGNKNYSFSRNIYVSPDRPVTQPYWLAQEMSPGSFNVSDQRLIGDPQGAPAYTVSFRFIAGDQELVLTRPIQYKYTDPVKGELYQPLTVLPPVTARFDPGLVLFTDGEEKGFRIDAIDHAGHGGLPKMELTPTARVNSVAPQGARNWVAKPVPGRPETETAGLLLERGNRRDTALQLITIAYDHIPRIDYFRPAREKFVLADVRTAGHRIGYIEGAGDKVPEALQQMGYEVVMVKERDCTAAYLRQFDAIIAGVRAFDVHGWLAVRHEALMDYVKEGGNLIVQYNRDNLNRMSTAIGPYPFAISNIRVTDEYARVNFLMPDHAVFNFPNKITEADFDGWIQERGIYFAGQTDSAYQKVLSMNDPGEPEQRGSLVIAPYGKGVFVYTGLVFFRELPAGVPGAYRLIANIIALNHKRGF